MPDTEMLQPMHGVLLTVDMTDSEALKKAGALVDSIRANTTLPNSKNSTPALRNNAGLPIIIVGTKSDKSDKKITEKELKSFVESYNSPLIVGPCITSAKNDKGIESGSKLLSVASNAFFANNPGFESENQAKASKILQQLEKYTSGGNKFIAWIKAIFSLGIFSLGVKKQNLAEDLKDELSKTADTGAVIQKYKVLNENLVSKEYFSSGPFAKHYVKSVSPKNSELILKADKGDLGKILDDTSSKTTPKH